MKQVKVLILGGSHRDIPLINTAKELGYFVITLGDRDYYLGHKYSDKSYKVNFNDLEKVKEIYCNENIDYLLPGSGEESYLNTVKLSQELGTGNFDTLETAQIIHNKWKFKSFCLKNNITVPKGIFYKQDSDLENISYPLVVKPTNLSGGRGVEIVNNIQELKSTLDINKNISEEFFLEEYIEGTLIAYSIIIKNQKVVYSFTAEDKTYLNKYLITTAYPINVDNTILNKLKKDIEKISHILKLTNGMFHLQILIKNNIPYIIDVTRRIPGDFFPNLIEYSDNIDYSKAVVEAYTTGNITANLTQTDNQKYFVIRHCIMPNKNGTYKNIFIDDILKNSIMSTFELIEKDSIVTDFLHTQIAIVFIKLDKKDKHILNNINKLIYPIIV